MVKRVFITGQVVSHQSDQTISVMAYSFVKHPRYGKYIKRQSFFKVHDGKNQAKTGDQVKIFSARPQSKTKRWQLKEVLEILLKEGGNRDPDAVQTEGGGQLRCQGSAVY